MSEAETWWYLSFAGPEGWRGAVFVQAPTFFRAVIEARVRNINPGGEGKGAELDNGDDTPEWARNILLTKADLLRLDREMGEPDPGPIRW